jgi:magnesium transporter
MKLGGKKKRFKIGQAPGTPVFTGTQKLASVKINLLAYDEVESDEFEISSLADLAVQLTENKRKLWVDIVGLHDEKLLEEIGVLLGLHRLTLEDILNVDQRPKIEFFEDYLFSELQMVSCAGVESPIESEQISLILKGNILISFQEKQGDVFSFVRNRITTGKGTIRRRDADYLLYALLDAVVDHYFLVLETVSDKIEYIEALALNNPDASVLQKLYLERRQILNLRRSVYPLREVISSFEKNAEQFVSQETKPFIRDLYDNTIQIIETMEVFRDMSSGVLDLYMNSLSNRMNNVMKMLTIISTIFIPLSFVAGIYGMNFEHMPELHWKYGYFYVLGGMLIAMIGMVAYFVRKKWI